MQHPTSPLLRALGAMIFVVIALASGTATAADWLLVGYLLPENGHPCVTDPYTQAGYVWIRKDENSKSHRDQLRNTVKAENNKASLGGQWPVRLDRPVFLVVKQLRCHDYHGKIHSTINHEFISAADEAALEAAMARKQKLYREIVGYTFEKIARPVSELDAVGTAVVVGRKR